MSVGVLSYVGHSNKRLFGEESREKRGPNSDVHKDEGKARRRVEGKERKDRTGATR